MRLPHLPPPTTFAEGQRMVFGCLVALAGMFSGAMAIAMICLLMWGGWSKAEEHSIVIIFGWSLGGFISSMAAVILALAVGGPVGKFSGKVGRDGVGFEASDHEAAAMPTVTATATVSAPTKPAAAPEGEAG